MKKLLSDYYTKWYIPLFVIFIIGFIFSYLFPFHNRITYNIALILLSSSFLLSFILGIEKLVTKQRLQGFLQIISTLLLAFLGIIFLFSFIMCNPHDYYADNLEIPTNIKLEKPLDSYNDTFEKQTDFKIYNGSQPGIYTYDISIGNSQKGTIYLKAFEITQNDPLSVKELEFHSAIPVKQHNSIMYHLLKEDFTIYEGDWDKPYAARFEMWFKDSVTGKETKLAQKNYKIEGWMR